MKIERIIDRCPLDSFGGQGLDKTEDVLYNESITMKERLFYAALCSCSVFF